MPTVAILPVKSFRLGKGRMAGDLSEEARSRLGQALAERTADLQRLQAEYLNYKRRVDRDRELVKETTTASVLSALLPVLDDIGRA
ncbi:MAG TPA: nucleotide exchange factor GrpE, partial [Acidimicrobiia bacterium]